MFGKHKEVRRHKNPLIIIFRLFLSLIMFMVLLVGIYSAYKHFSGLDPLKLDPQAFIRSAFEAKTPQQFLSLLSKIKLNTGFSLPVNQKVIPQDKAVLGQSQTPTNYAFRFLLVADTHDDNNNLQKAISQAKQRAGDLAFIIGLGDYTNVGTIAELRDTKAEFDQAGLRYFLTPGDHDLWDSRNRNLEATTNFKQIFGPNFQSFNYNGFRFLLLDNSDDYIGFSKEQSNWINLDLEKVKEEGSKGIFVFLHEPLYHPSSDHYMGKIQKDLKTQAKSMIYQLKAANVKKVFAGDIHYFSEYEEPETKLSMVTIGAVVTDRNPQAPRYAMVTVFDDGSTKVEDMEIR